MSDVDEFGDEIETLSVGTLAIKKGASDKEIERHFDTGRLRVVQEKNDIFLSHVVDFIGGKSAHRVWGNLRPEYQRRLRWSNKKKSQLIESLIMNIPIPPVFLYEKDLGSFEVMDGQQRLNAIAEFWTGKFELEGLEIWEALNGRTYSNLPPRVKRGLERAKMSAITLMSDNTSGEEDSVQLRAQVFERLNTGGEKLNPQELRNSLYSGDFNRLLVELSKERIFTDAWDIPPHNENTLSDGTVTNKLKSNSLYKRMTDVEIALRFFAFREDDDISGSVRGILDRTMKDLRDANEEELTTMRGQFISSLETCRDIFGEDMFKIPATKKSRASRPLYDAEMVGVFRNLDKKQRILAHKDEIRERVLSLVEDIESESYALMVARGNTAGGIKKRIKKVSDIIKEVVG